MPKAAASRSKAKDSKPVKGKKKGEPSSSPEPALKKEKNPPKQKKPKDPNAPKRGLSAYMFFANEQRDKLRAEQPNLKFGEVGKVLGEKWKALTDGQKAPYEKKAAADKKRYEDEKAAYQAATDEEPSSSASSPTLVRRARSGSVTTRTLSKSKSISTWSPYVTVGLLSLLGVVSSGLYVIFFSQRG